MLPAMTSVSSRARLVHVAFAALLVVAAVACGGDDAADDKKDPTTEPSASTTDEPAPKPVTVYDDYESQQYDGTTHWICHPGLADDECRDLDTTEIQADGTSEVKEVEPAEDPPIDCFYAYPTASDDPAPNADFEVNNSEIDTVRAQTAQFGTVCRMFAPAYRQVPLIAVTSGDPAARQLAYDDVLDAFKTYMAQENDGRGVVLIGHSQGAFILQRIIAEEIDPNADVRALLVSALLLGTSVQVPEGADVGGEFKEIPACTEAGQTGCVISFASFPADRPPAEATGGSFFGRASGEGMQALCVNPVELAGGDGLADPIMLNKQHLLGSVGPYTGVETPFVSLPGVLKAECVTSGTWTYLAYSPAGAAGETRDVAKLMVELLGPTWGLHLVDSNLPQGDLLEVVAKQAESYTD
jgi:hypothetical protein